MMAWLSPARWLLLLGLLGSLWLAYGRFVDHQRGIGRAEAVAEFQAQAEATEAKREVVTQVVEVEHVKVVQQIATITETITKEVPIYVKADDCPMPGGFRVLHDAAARGEVPNPAAIADAAAVPAQDLAVTVTENYGSCRITAQRLADLQAWVSRQQALH